MPPGCTLGSLVSSWLSDTPLCECTPTRASLTVSGGHVVLAFPGQEPLGFGLSLHSLGGALSCTEVFFIVLALTISPLIHFGLISCVWCEVGVHFILLHVGAQLSQLHR